MPERDTPENDPSESGDAHDAAVARRKRLLFRCHHTGMKENDLLIGAFADRHLGELSDDDVAWLEELLGANDDIDLYNWITGQKPYPAKLEHPVMRALLAFEYSR